MSVRAHAHIASLVWLAVLAGCATEPKHHRWNPNGSSSNTDWHSPVATIMKYDADHDGTLTRAELEQGLRRDFDAFDTKHTGCLTPDQVTAINEARASVDEAAASPMIDWKHNGCVDFDEFAAMARSLFEQLDKNSDGKLTPDELHPKAQQNGSPSRRSGAHGRHAGSPNPNEPQ